MFWALLNELGYRASLQTATVHLGDERWGMENSHLFIIVEIHNRKYLVDVGFGGTCPRQPIPLDGQEEVNDGYHLFRIVSGQENETYSKLMFELQKKTDDQWESLYVFDNPFHQESLNWAQVKPISVRTETAEESIFNKQIILSKATDKGRITLFGQSFIEVKGTEKSKRIVDEQQMQQIAQRHFHITI